MLLVNIFIFASCAKTKPTEIPIIKNPWTQKANMLSGRCGHASVTINGKAYVMGGYFPYGYQNTVEVYSPINNAWSNTATMLEDRGDFAAVELNGKAYIFGGENNDPSILNTVEEFDENQWVQKTPMPTSRKDLAASVVQSKVYVIGGYNGSYLSTVEEYNPYADTVGGTPWIARASMPTARGEFQTAVVNNKIYSLGGLFYDTLIGNYRFCTEVEEYDPITNNWLSKQSMPSPRFDFAAVVVNSKIYVIGGKLSYAMDTCSVIMFDPVANNWSNKTLMPINSCDFAATVLVDKIYVTGGAHYDASYQYNGGWIYYYNFYIYDPALE